MYIIQQGFMPTKMSVDFHYIYALYMHFIFASVCVWVGDGVWIGGLKNTWTQGRRNISEKGNTHRKVCVCACVC